jgi:hypothetical protein
MTEVLGYEISDVEMTLQQTNLLLDRDSENHQSLLNPVAMSFFFEAYKEGKFDAIRARFSFVSSPLLNNDQITGIYKYL